MVQHLKAALRKEMLKKRDCLIPEQIKSMSEAIRELLFSNKRFKEAKTVAFYLKKGSEVDTNRMIGHALRLGKEVLVPVTDHKMSFCRFSTFPDLQPGRYGIPEPKTKALPLREPDVVVVPGIAFGLCMHRLGYGKGYYDKYLSTSAAYRIGICYDFQIVDKLPRHEDDQRMDEIITEKRTITLE